MSAHRTEFIETLRGLACVLLVSWHVVGAAAEDGLHLPVDHPLHLIGEALVPLRMPLFAFISGYVFNALAQDWRTAGEKVRVKARRLLLPLLVVGTTHFLIRSTLNDYPLDRIWRPFFGSYVHFWYLQAAFVVMTVLLIANVLARGRELRAAAFCMAAAIVLYLLDLRLEPVNWFSITMAFYLAPFFLLGQLFRNAGLDARLQAFARARWTMLAALAVLIIVLYVLRETALRPSGMSFRVHSLEMLALSLALCAFFFILRWRNKWLAMLGPYSYAIFLFHVLLIGAIRRVDEAFIHLPNEYLSWALGMAVGLGAPIAIVKLLKHAPPLFETLLLGVRYRRGPRQTPVTA